MTDQKIMQPPASLLQALVTPDVRTLLAEVRSDASLPFDPAAAPNYLVMNNVAFGALIVWRVDVSWLQAQEIQKWLAAVPSGLPPPPPPAPPATPPPNTRDRALKDFFETLQTGTPPNIEYVGTYLLTGASHASYTLVLGMRNPVKREVYQAAFTNALDVLQASFPLWFAELMQFVKMMLGQPSSREEFVSLAVNIGDLARNDPAGNPMYPIIKRLIT
jgi:hypothetical protein